jgi:hypothetical protein
MRPENSLFEGCQRNSRAPAVAPSRVSVEKQADSRFHGAHRDTPAGCAPTPWCRVRERQGRDPSSIAGRGVVFCSGSESVG